MFTFKHPVVHLREFTTAFAEDMGAKMINDRFSVPPSIGSGYVQLIDLPIGLSAMIMHFTLHTDMHYEQSRSDQELYTLRFEENSVPYCFTTQIDHEFDKDSRDYHDSAYLVGSHMDLGYIVTKDTSLKCITIQMPKEWLGRYLRMEVYDEILQQYIALKTASLHIEPLDSEYKRIMDDVISVDKAHPTHFAMIQNRTMALVERFFNNLYEKRYHFTHQLKATTHDIEQIIKVEHAITGNYSEPCPTINKLAKMASMSPSKLKQLFKDVYGKPIYQYYQASRMQKAKAMLLSKKFSVKEVGMTLGYVNLSNFSTAFRKEFNMLPSELAGR